MLLQASQPHPLSHRQFSKSEAESESSNQESRDPTTMEVSFSARQMSPSGPDHNGNAGKSPVTNPDFSSEATAAALAANFPSFPFLGSAGVAGSALNLTSPLPPKTETFDEEDYPSKKDFSAHLQGKITLNI